LIDFGRSVCAVHIVEASHELRSQQKESLEQALGHIIDFQFVEQSLSNANDQDAGGAESKQHDSQQEERSSSNGPIAKIPIRVEWHEDFGSFQHRRNKDVPVMMFLQEFLDALPVHVFERTASGWRERLIDVASAEDKPANTQESLVPRLRQVMSPEVTPAVNLFLESNNAYDNVPLGSVVEVCPEALLLVQDMAKVLEESQGVSLIIDYGQEGTSDTLRAFSNHLQVPLTSYPGQVDVTADVDFYALKACLGNSEISAFGPVTQGEFLMRMGAGDMVIHAIEQPEATPEHAKRLSDALKYLVLPEHMGERYKVLALGRKRDGIFGPPGMERSIK
jgi:NADH dehydrogenase [ubiquinone] 1 alpha subcomplex assembly factor 7